MGIIILWMEKRVLIFHISTLFLMILTFPDIQTLPSEHIVLPYYKGRHIFLLCSVELIDLAGQTVQLHR